MLYGFLLLGGAGFVVALSGMARPVASSRFPDVRTVPVTRGLLRSVVTERGTIDSARNITITNSVEWPTTIVSLVPEGTRVNQGDVICRLDSSELEQRAKERQVLLIEADAEVHEARENVTIRRMLNERDVARAELNLKLAKLDLQKYREGEFTQQVDKLLGEIRLAETDLTRARERYDFTKRVSLKGYSTYDEVEKTRIALHGAEIKLDVAKGQLNVLEGFTHTRTLKELEANSLEFEREVVRVRQRAKVALLQAEIALTSRERKARMQRTMYERYLKNIRNCTIRAPQDGEAVYAINPRTNDVVEEGASVRFRQTLIKLPDLEHMQVEATIHESQVRHVAEGQPALVHVSALHDELFDGEVESIATVPNLSDAYRYRQKNYEARIRLAADDPHVTRLRPGMTAFVQIEVERRENVLRVPQQSVVDVLGEHVAFVLTDEGPESRKVLVGRANATDVEIVRGLEEGEAVVLNPRSDMADVVRELEDAVGD